MSHAARPVRFPGAFLKLRRFRLPTLVVDENDIYGGLVHQADGAIAWFRNRLTTEFVFTGAPQRVVKWEYPLAVIREAVVNVLCHRSYLANTFSDFRYYDDRLELWNAGSLPSPLMPEDLYEEHDSIPRNRKIAEIFYYMGLIERWSSGTLRIIEELNKSGLPKPEFSSDSGRFKSIFHKQILATDEELKNMGLSERQLEALNYVKTHGSISNSDYQTLTQVSKRTASRELNELKAKGLFVSDSVKGRGVLYQLSDKKDA